MTFKGTPFIWSMYDKFKGADINAIIKNVTKKSSKGIDITGIAKICQFENMPEMTLEERNGAVDNSGVDITGGLKYVDGDNFGMDLTGIGKIVKCDNSGLDLTGILKIVDGENTGLSLTGFYNQFGSVDDWSVSYATFGNVIKEVGPDAFYLQVGLFNRAGDHYSPLINIGGVKNLLRRLKK